VVTESGLSHPVSPETTKTEIKFNGNLATPEGVVTKEWKDKKIHEIIDMEKDPPEKIKITRADGKTTTEATLKEKFWEEKIKTYVITKNNKEERVQILPWDKIDPIQKEVAKPVTTKPVEKTEAKAAEKPAEVKAEQPVEKPRTTGGKDVQQNSNNLDNNTKNYE
jgi:hypothetical protein